MTNLKAAEKIWNYLHINHKLEKADCILVIGSIDMRPAKYGAELYLKGLAPIMICAGGLGRMTKEAFNEPEADKLSKIAIKCGVSKDKIYIENKSTNTGENIQFTKELVKKEGLDIKKIIAIQKPYMERRIYATAKKVWPEMDIIVTSPKASFEDYTHPARNKDELIDVIVADLQRIKLYAKKGFQIPQIIPKDVWAAYKQLVTAGHTSHLVK